ncbi:MAG: FtsB family cell division protein [Flavobacteriales bacterium Tduv]
MEKFDAKEGLKLKPLLKSKYFWTGTFFLLWMIFFDTNSFMIHWNLEKDIKKMKSEQAYLKKKITTEKDQLNKIHTELGYLEKVARERFYMKRDNEELFIVTEKKRLKNIREKTNDPQAFFMTISPKYIGKRKLYQKVGKKKSGN